MYIYLFPNCQTCQENMLCLLLPIFIPFQLVFYCGQRELLGRIIWLNCSVGKEGRARCRGQQGMPDVGASRFFCMITFHPLVGRAAPGCQAGLLHGLREVENLRQRLAILSSEERERDFNISYLQCQDLKSPNRQIQILSPTPVSCTFLILDFVSPLTF